MEALQQYQREYNTDRTRLLLARGTLLANGVVSNGITRYREESGQLVTIRLIDKLGGTAEEFLRP